MEEEFFLGSIIFRFHVCFSEGVDLPFFWRFEASKSSPDLEDRPCAWKFKSFLSSKRIKHVKEMDRFSGILQVLLVRIFFEIDSSMKQFDGSFVYNSLGTIYPFQYAKPRPLRPGPPSTKPCWNMAFTWKAWCFADGSLVVVTPHEQWKKGRATPGFLGYKKGMKY